MNFHTFIAHVESDIRYMQKIVRKELLNDVSLLTLVDGDVIYSVVIVSFKDVPKNGHSANLDHWLGPNRGLF